MCRPGPCLLRNHLPSPAASHYQDEGEMTVTEPISPHNHVEITGRDASAMSTFACRRSHTPHLPDAHTPRTYQTPKKQLCAEPIPSEIGMALRTNTCTVYTCMCKQVHVSRCQASTAHMRATVTCKLQCLRCGKTIALCASAGKGSQCKPR